MSERGGESVERGGREVVEGNIVAGVKENFASVIIYIYIIWIRAGRGFSSHVPLVFFCIIYVYLYIYII